MFGINLYGNTAHANSNVGQGETGISMLNLVISSV